MKTKKIKQKARIVVRYKYPKFTNNYRKMHGKATRRGEANRDFELYEYFKDIWKRRIRNE